GRPVRRVRLSGRTHHARWRDSVQFRTGGERRQPQARDPVEAIDRWTWCESRADGDSPDGRERAGACTVSPPVAAVYRRSVLLWHARVPAVPLSPRAPDAEGAAMAR